MWARGVRTGGPRRRRRGRDEGARCRLHCRGDRESGGARREPGAPVDRGRRDRRLLVWDEGGDPPAGRRLPPEAPRDPKQPGLDDRTPSRALGSAPQARDDAGAALRASALLARLAHVPPGTRTGGVCGNRPRRRRRPARRTRLLVTGAFEVGASTQLRALHRIPWLPPPEGDLHAHDYRVEVVVERADLDERGMVCDLDLVGAALARAVGEL